MEQMDRHISDTSSWADGQALRPSVRPRIDFYKLSVTSVPSVPLTPLCPPNEPTKEIGGTYRIDTRHLSTRYPAPNGGIGGT